ncbi:hypothetical protein LshimejAT787_0505360 [Lyophyllum shimeji]|uniref:Uncharacterized protein n=1 Tax=Lyophyllum shimeji TaxID=47721 RepID=A0A9P3PNS0_LYOSH|nr:hypothetical protein LshimejAT787_0505360 [Lyophyllum shimeji]
MSFANNDTNNAPKNNTAGAVPGPGNTTQQRRARGQGAGPARDDLSDTAAPRVGTGTLARGEQRPGQGQGPGRDNTAGMYASAGEDQFVRGTTDTDSGPGAGTQFQTQMQNQNQRRQQPQTYDAPTTGGRTGGNTLGSSGTDAYGAGAGMGGTGTGVSTAGAGFSAGGGGGQGEGVGAGESAYGRGGIAPGIGYGGPMYGAGYAAGPGAGQGGISGPQGEVKPSVGDRMRGGAERVAGKLTRNPEMVERGEERSTGEFDATRGQHF